MAKVWRGVLVCAALMGGCVQPGGGADGPPVVREGPPTDYGTASAAFNRTVEALGRLRAAAVVRMDFLDAEGERRREQGEGRLQVIQPDRVALDVGKLGETLLWLGCDGERYWWLDLSGKERVGYVGRHENFERSDARRRGVVVQPQDLTRLLGIVPLSRDRGGTQWSRDGRMLGLSSPLPRGGTQRTWVNPADYQPRLVELFDAKGEVQLIAELQRPEFVSVRGVGGLGPRVATRIRISHMPTGSLLTLDLDDLTDGTGRMSEDAFRLDALLTAMRVSKRVDLDGGSGERP